MIELVLLVCLLSDPTQCHQEKPAFEAPNESMHACLFQGQIVAAQWAAAHPKYVVRRWTCGLSST